MAYSGIPKRIDTKTSSPRAQHRPDTPLISGRADFTFTQRRKHDYLLTRPALRALLRQHMHRPDVKHAFML